MTKSNLIFNNKLVLSNYDYLPSITFIPHSDNRFTLVIGGDDFELEIKDGELISTGHGSMMFPINKKKSGSYKLDEIIPDKTEQDRITPIEVNLPKIDKN